MTVNPPGLLFGQCPFGGALPKLGQLSPRSWFRYSVSGGNARTGERLPRRAQSRDRRIPGAPSSATRLKGLAASAVGGVDVRRPLVIAPVRLRRVAQGRRTGAHAALDVPAATPRRWRRGALIPSQARATSARRGCAARSGPPPFGRHHRRADHRPSTSRSPSQLMPSTT